VNRQGDYPKPQEVETAGPSANGCVMLPAVAHANSR
jgi:hypothetical protein